MSRVRTRAGLAAGVVAALASGLVAGVLATALPVLPAAPALAAQDPSACNATVALADGGFELPAIKDGTLAFLPDSQLPGWLTTATDHLVEIWRGFQGVPPAAGSQFAELNATQPSTLYQDLPTTPGQTLRWELAHRGRAGTDVMAVVLGRPGLPLVGQGNLSDGRTAWGVHSGTYTVPAGQTTTRFGFQAVSSAGGNPSVGNFLDNISFGTGPCVLTTTTATTRYGGPTANVGELVTYTVSAANRGGNPARGSVVSVPLPAGVSWVDGSIRAVTADGTQARTDQAGDDQGEYDPATRTVRVRVGLDSSKDAGGVIRPDDTRSVSFQVRVATANAGTTLTTEATTVFRDDLAGRTTTSTSNAVSTPVDPAADLAVAVAHPSGAPVAGEPTRYTATLTNRGPSTDPAARFTLTLPAGLAGAVVTAPGSTCSTSGRTVTCAAGAMASGDTRTAEVTGTVPAATPGGEAWSFEASAASGAFDPVGGNNDRVVSDLVTTSADVGVVLTGPPGATAGEEVVYTAAVAANGPSVARDVLLVDPLPAGSAFVPAGSDSRCAANRSTGSDGRWRDTVTCALGDLAPGATDSVSIRVALDPAGVGAVDNTVRVTAATLDAVPGNNVSSATPTSLTVAADLSAELTVSPAAVRPGDTVGFTLVVRNAAGGSTARDISFVTVLPPGVRITALDTSLAPGATCGTATSGCTVPTLAPGASITLSGQAVVEAGAPAGAVVAAASVVSPTYDPVAGNNTSEDHDLAIVLSADLAVTQLVTNADQPGEPVVAGGRVHSEVTAANAGPTRADGVVLRMPVPSGQPVPTLGAGGGTCHHEGTVTDGLAVDGAVVVCTLPTLAAGSSWTVTSDTLLRASNKDDWFTRTRVVTAASPDPGPGANTSVLAVPQVRRSDIAVAVTTATPRVVQTEEVRFQVVVTNNGPSDARDLLVRGLPHPGVLVDGATPSMGSYSQANGAWRLVYLAAGRSATLDVVGTAQSPDPVTYEARFVPSEIARTAAGPGDPPLESTALGPADDVATADVDVVPASRSLTVVPSTTVSRPGAAVVGDTIAYEYRVTNDGNVPMSGIVVTDSLVAEASCPLSALAPGAAMTCTAPATHRVTQAEFDAGQDVVSVTTVTAAAPGGTAPLSFGPVAVAVPVASAARGLSAVAIADRPGTAPNSALGEGEPVVWSVYVTNTGEVTLSDLSVAADPWAPAATCTRTSLGPGSSTSCTTAAYTVTAADVLGGTLTWTPTVSAADPRGGPPVVAGSSVSSPAAPLPALGVAVSRVPGTALPDVGDTVQWRYRVTNLGNLQLLGIAVPTGTTTCDLTTLAPGATTLCTDAVLQQVTEADVLAGRLTRTAIATAGTAGGTPVASPADTAQVLVAPVRAAVAMSTAVEDPATGTAPATTRSGDRLRWTFSVTNTGNVALAAVGIDDPDGAVTCLATTLPRGSSTTCSVDVPYAVTAEDARRGRLTHSARASGEPPTGSGALQASRWQSVDVLVEALPADPVTPVAVPVPPAPEPAGPVEVVPPADQQPAPTAERGTPTGPPAAVAGEPTVPPPVTVSRPGATRAAAEADADPGADDEPLTAAALASAPARHGWSWDVIVREAWPAATVLLLVVGGWLLFAVRRRRREDEEERAVGW